MVAVAAEAAGVLAAEGIEATVVNVSTLKPFDADRLGELISGFGAVVTAENHSAAGGLFSATCEVMAAEGLRAHVVAVGVRDRFPGFGSVRHVASELAMTAEGIVAAARTALERRDGRTAQP